MYITAEITKLQILKNPEITEVVKSTLDPINTAAIRYPIIWLLKSLYFDLPRKKLTSEVKIIIINPAK